MATNEKYLNISIQPSKLPRTSKATFELPRENLSNAELSGKSTSDRTKRRVAHDAWFPLPVIPRLAVAPVQVVNQPNPIKEHALKKEDSFSHRKSCNVRQINETVDLDSRAQRSKSTSSGVDDRVKANIRELEFDEKGTKKKQKKGNVDKSKYKDVKQREKARPSKGLA
ncbi:uncharacterized protein LOC100570422 [Acyrthosiphon pisum]|uniref:Uncharacterized protein n=1 Tax=Acyrthosiphon pisum TaxID=7029 RepID=A0A8R1W7T4_ACYPI|nr:uncharacterized protein LOC100570422 [Acyrthosiphon pisum]XP_008181246.1 uncharacterized protein LOC100570422 [Acyrthosiphon pisum]XP_016658468.1 uncharacterized protein LOC100570422 [Acyrthosiphon pisum]XP_016658469.1 uncharacterized protein LOC100570422 [Acyrthosiphon pisum]|eukprot:XP_003243305.1 PREDICTED: uncharacterized protein LOC100570422 isoform X2 [Acyrthosiphon pisum]